MLIFKERTRKKTRAQAMVEFALALPILLLVVYGLLETGRLLFIYASTVTAARQAVRYGSATGISGNGVPYYEDCAGIIAAVQNVGFINRFDPADILISYDEGPGETAIPGCPPADPPENGHRINVQVSTDWGPIVPIVPLGPFTIRASSSRTILASVAIVVTAPPSSFSGSGGGTVQLTVTANPGPYTTVGQQIQYMYQISNTGSGDLLAPWIFSDDLAGVDMSNCDAVAPGVLTAGASFTCSGSYTITQDDMNVGFVQNLTTAQDGTGSSDQDSITITLTQMPALSLSKSGSPDASSVVGTVITYTYTVTNIGNVGVTDVIVDDNLINNVNCSGMPNPLEAGAQATCTATYELRQTDINRGTVTNRATAEGEFGGAPVVSNEATFTVYTPPIYLTINVNPASVNQAGQTVTYTYNIINNTEDSLSGPFSITDSRYTVTCPQPGSLGSGSTLQCSVSYVVTQADIDAGTAISNTAQASAGSGNRALTSNPVTASLLIVQDVGLTLGLTATPQTLTPADTAIVFTYTLTNTGKVTLYPATPTDTLGTTITCAGSGALAPSAQRVCTGTRQVTDADRTAGSLTDQATVQYNVGAAGGRTATATSNAVTVVTFDGPRLTMTVTGNLNPANVGNLITFTYLLRNTGNTTLAQPYTITSAIYDANDTLMANVNVSCALARNTLVPGESTTCTGEYTPGQAGSFQNRSSATATNQDDPPNPPPTVQTTTPFTVNQP